MTAEQGKREQGDQENAPRDADQTRMDIELTRAELGQTVEQLVDKANVAARMREGADRIGAKAAETVPEPALPWVESGIRVFRRQPLLTTGGAVLCLLVLIKLLRRARS